MLDELFKKKSASFVVIRERRRIEKSRLTQKFAQKIPRYIFSRPPPTSGISATDQMKKSVKGERRRPLSFQDNSKRFVESQN